jgi:hypothetical protein
MKKQEVIPLFLSIKQSFAQIRSSQTLVKFIKQKADGFNTLNFQKLFFNLIV